MIGGLWDLFLTYPPSVQVAVMAAVIGLIGVCGSAVIAFVGVAITNGGHGNRLMLQLSAEDTRRRVDREMALRKDIYLEVAEAVQAGLVTISKLGEPTISHTELLKNFEGKASAISKAQLIARQPLIDALQELGGTFADALHELLLKRLPLQQNLNKLKIANASLGTFAANRDEHLRQLGDVTKQFPLNEALFGLLNGRYEFEAGRVTKAIAEIQALEVQQAQMRRGLAREVLELHTAARRKVPRVLDEARKELQLPIDIVKYSSQMEHWIKKDADRLDRFIAQLEGVQGGPTVHTTSDGVKE